MLRRDDKSFSGGLTSSREGFVACFLCLSPIYTLIASRRTISSPLIPIFLRSD
jgi:hypothetical protein